MAQHINFPRQYYEILKERLGKFSPLIQIVCGPRQVGKTTSIKTLISELNGNAVYVNFDNPGPTPHDKIKFEWERATKLSGHKLIVFDEIQNVKGWASLIKELYDEERPKRELSVAILGSSAIELLLSSEESLLGRYELIRASHWNAYETSKAFNWGLEEFLQFGGYPILSEMFNKNSNESDYSRCQNFLRDAIIEPIITRDIFSIQNVANTPLFRQILKITLSLPCEEISFTKLLGQISSKGGSATVKNYLELMEKAFLIKLLHRYSGGVIRKRTSTPKIVPLAPALIHAYSDPLRIKNDPTWFGHVYESTIISRILETNFELFYWSNSREDVDLVIESNNLLIAIEIKSSNTYDSRGLNAFKKAYPKAKTLVIDRKLGDQLLLCNEPKEFLLNLVS
jgi:predicted AAA+ superfamily ATPase